MEKKETETVRPLSVHTRSLWIIQNYLKMLVNSVRLFAQGPPANLRGEMIKGWSYQGPGQGFCVNFCKKCGDSGECCGKNNSPNFSALLTKIHHIDFLLQINVRSAVNAENVMKKKSPHFTAFLGKFHRICFPTFIASDLSSQEISSN